MALTGVAESRFRRRGLLPLGLLLLAAAAAAAGAAFTAASRGTARGRHCRRPLLRRPQAPSLAAAGAVAGRATEQRLPAVRRDAEPDGAADEAAPARSMRVTALGGSRGSFLLEMGGQRLLINPNLEGSTQLDAEQVHEQVDYVILTSGKEEFLHRPTLEKMNLLKVNFVAAASAGELASQMMVRNLAVLAPGPGGRALLEGGEGAAPLAVLVAPGKPGLPWEAPETAFIFVNLETGLAIAYEASGQFLGPGAASEREGIPEEAYQVDYLITPDLREGAAVAKGLTEKGAVLRGVVHLPDPQASAAGVEGGPSPLLAPLVAFDRSLDAALGGVGDDAEEFQEFLRKEGPPLAETRCLLPVIGGEPVLLE